MKPRFIQIRKTPEEKLLTRPLYERIFADSVYFTDYYYTEKCRDNIIVTAADSDEPDAAIRSMVHLNPFRLSVCGKEVLCFYLAAVATDASFRRQGYMAEVLYASFEYMKKQQIPFCYLLPVDPAIYAGFGFETICHFSETFIPYDQVKKNYDIYCIRDETYQQRLNMEQKIGELEKKLPHADDLPVGSSLPPHPVIMARIIDPESFDKISGMDLPERSETASSLRLAWLRSRRIYIREEI